MVSTHLKNVRQNWIISPGRGRRSKKTWNHQPAQETPLWKTDFFPTTLRVGKSYSNWWVEPLKHFKINISKHLIIYKHYNYQNIIEAVPQKRIILSIWSSINMINIKNTLETVRSPKREASSPSDQRSKKLLDRSRGPILDVYRGSHCPIALSSQHLHDDRRRMWPCSSWDTSKFVAFFSISAIVPPKKIEHHSERWWLEDDFPFGFRSLFRGKLAVKLPGCI